MDLAPRAEAGVLPPRADIRDDGAGLRQDLSSTKLRAGWFMKNYLRPRAVDGGDAHPLSVEERAGRGWCVRSFGDVAPPRHRFQHASGDPAGRHPADTSLRHRRARRWATSSSSPASAGCSPTGWFAIGRRSRHAGRRHAAPDPRVNASELLGKVSGVAPGKVLPTTKSKPTFSGRMTAMLVRRSALAGRLLTRLHRLQLPRRP